MTNKRFIEQFEENVQRYPDKVILRDEHNSLTFRELDELSGRVYAYLKEKGIGREDFVMIDLLRGVKQYAAMLGIWKAGAAQVCVEDNFPKDRKLFVYEDCNCKLLLNNPVFDKICNHIILEGYEVTRDTDAALALYTSGSDGTPKGTLHEYGKLTEMSHSVLENGKLIFHADDRFGLILPMCHIAGLLLINSAIYVGCYIDIVPYDVMFEAAKLEAHINAERLTITGTIPSIAKYDYNTPSLRYFMTGAEMSSNIYSEKYAFLNIYGQTEVAMATFTFVIDKPYEVTPIGIPSGVKNVQIIDGELCYEHTFSRGYINQSGLTKEKFFDGLYHTGDIARINEDGNYVILGRKTDMIKINGNRIEPAEIEAAVKRVLGIDWAFAKGFVEKDHSYIVVYYTADINLPSPTSGSPTEQVPWGALGEGTGVRLSHIREQLLDILPTYMIPSYFVHLDEVPHLPNGKVDRQALKAPEIEQYRAEYVAPENDIEEQLCTQMERILGTKMGALDDFYLLGGDSLRTIQLVTNLSQQPSTLNPQLSTITVTDIYAARTPRAIAARLQSKVAGARSSTVTLEDRGYLLPYSQMVYDLEQQIPGVYTFPFTLEYDPEQIDTARLNSAIATAIAAHPVFEGNEQYYSIEAMEAKGEKARGYLKMRLNRILGDGYSFGILLEDICRAYHGLPIPEDRYIDYLVDYQNHTQSLEYAEHRDVLVAHYADCGSEACPVRPTLDKEIEEGDEWLAGEYILSLPNSVSEGGKGTAKPGDRGYSLNERVCLATAMAIMDYCGTDAAALTWAYLGRENEQQMHIFGSLHKDIPLVVKKPIPQPLSIDERGDAMKMAQEQVREEMQRGIIMSDYPYTLTQPYHDTWAYAVNVLQQPRLEDINLHGLEFTPLINSSQNEQAYSLLDIEIEDNLLRFKYSATHYRESSIVRFAELIQKYLLS